MRLTIGLICFQSLSEAKAGPVDFPRTDVSKKVPEEYNIERTLGIFELQFFVTPDKDGM